MTKQTSKPTRKPIGQMTKLALEMGPLVVFFLSNLYGDRLAKVFPILEQLGGKLFIGTALFMVAMAISLTLTWILERRLAIMPLVTGIMVFFFGGLTLYLQDETFIKIKPTIANIFFGTILLGAMFLRGKALMKYLFGSAFKLDDEGWKKLTIRWGFWFFFLAAVNEVVWRNFSTDFWVIFKVWGTMPMTMAFMLFQVPLLSKHGLPDEEDTEENA